MSVRRRELDPQALRDKFPSACPKSHDIQSLQVRKCHKELFYSLVKIENQRFIFAQAITVVFSGIYTVCYDCADYIYFFLNPSQCSNFIRLANIKAII